MKQLIFGLIFTTIIVAQSHAQDVYVVSAQPRLVTVYQQQCQQILVQRPASSGNNAGGVRGAIAGAALGNQVGGGSGKDIATVVGGVVGYQLGRGDAQPGGTEYQTVCNQIPVTVQRGETVTFSYRGRRFTQVFD